MNKQQKIQRQLLRESATPRIDKETGRGRRWQALLESSHLTDLMIHAVYRNGRLSLYK